MFDSFLKNYSLGGNWVDLVFILLILYFALTSRGLIRTLIDALAFIFSLIFSYKLYSLIGKLLIYNFSVPQGIAFAVGYFAAWFLAEGIFYLLISKIPKVWIAKFNDNPLNGILGAIAGAFQAGIIFLFIVSLIFAFPVRPQIKEAIMTSRTGPVFIDLSQTFEKQLKSVFGQAISETLNFLTIKPESGEVVDLGVRPKESQLSYDSNSESTMYSLLNQEREKAGEKTLVFDEDLNKLARDYAMEMFKNGFFAHVSSVDGSTPADRANRHNIFYTVIGENLAFAPDVYIAHQGLMNSQGHRENILAPDFGKVGIGILDGGIYGKIFVQEFTN